jgi:hypothetical protein
MKIKLSVRFFGSENLGASSLAVSFGEAKKPPSSQAMEAILLVIPQPNHSNNGKFPFSLHENPAKSQLFMVKSHENPRNLGLSHKNRAHPWLCLQGTQSCSK